jgi:hypothetical protein
VPSWTTAARSLTSGTLLFAAALLAVFANFAGWATRTLFDTDEFVSTSESTMRQPEVQTATSNRIADIVVERGDLHARIVERLPPGLEPVSDALTEAERAVIQRAALRLLQSDAFQELVDRALRRAHSTVVGILEDDDTLIGVNGTSVVLDLQPFADRVKEDLSSQGQGALLANVTLPPDAGRIVLIDDAKGFRAASVLADHRRLIVASILAAGLLSALLSVAVARERRVAVRRLGVALTLGGALSILLIAATRYAVIQFVRDETATRVAFNQFTVMYRWQSLGMMAVGLVVAGLAVLAGNSHAARAIRAVRHRDLGTDAVEELRAARAPMIAVGLVVTSLILLGWPQPGTRVYVTAGLVYAAFVAGILLLTSDAAWARERRAQLQQAWRGGSGSPASGEQGRGARNYLARERRVFEFAGVALAVVTLIALPSLSLATLTLTALLLTAWIASIEWLVAPK